VKMRLRSSNGDYRGVATSAERRLDELERPTAHLIELTGQTLPMRVYGSTWFHGSYLTRLRYGWLRCAAGSSGSSCLGGVPRRWRWPGDWRSRVDDVRATEADRGRGARRAPVAPLDVPRNASGGLRALRGCTRGERRGRDPRESSCRAVPRAGARSRSAPRQALPARGNVGCPNGRGTTGPVDRDSPSCGRCSSAARPA
jgi:hypothetical protein